jgi:hypothetical protein
MHDHIPWVGSQGTCGDMNGGSGHGVDSTFLGGFDTFEYIFSYPKCPKPIFLEGEVNRADLFQRKVRRVKSLTSVSC